jgi:AmiR/NasT family two-component response regulator
MTHPLLAVLSSESAGEPWLGALATAGGALLGCATCETMVRQVAALAPQQVVILAPPAIETLLDALQAWNGQPPCPISLIGGPWQPVLHEQLVALGVHAWMPQDGIDVQGLAALLARAGARWRREQALRGELAQLRERFDERKWVDRAKGLLMSARGMDEDEAFGLLRGAAMHANLRLGEVSRSVVEAAQWAEAVNRAGQLRMLSQHIVRLAAQGLAGIDARRGRAAREQAALRARDNLAHLAALELDSAGAEALDAASNAWRALEAIVETRISPAVLAQADARAETLLVAAEALTQALEAAGARRALRIVNICGRQRMRVQRLAKDALLASLLADGAARERLAGTMAEFEAALRELEDAPLSTPEIRTALADARSEWLRLVSGAGNAGSAEGRAVLARSSDALADVFDRLTASYEHSLQVIMS